MLSEDRPESDSSDDNENLAECKDRADPGTSEVLLKNHNLQIGYKVGKPQQRRLIGKTQHGSRR